jgi:hypothetical protein
MGRRHLATVKLPPALCWCFWRFRVMGLPYYCLTTHTCVCNKLQNPIACISAFTANTWNTPFQPLTTCSDLPSYNAIGWPHLPVQSASIAAMPGHLWAGHSVSFDNYDAIPLTPAKLKWKRGEQPNKKGLWNQSTVSAKWAALQLEGTLQSLGVC